MNLTIEIPDDNAAKYQKVAHARGLSVERWILELADSAAAPINEARAKPVQPVPHIADIILDNMKDVPPEIMATMPTDGASQHDHYIYGWPKKTE